MKYFRPVVILWLALWLGGWVASADHYETRMADLKARLEKGQLGKFDYELEVRDLLEEQAAMKSFEVCILNLKLLDGAKQMWGIEKKKAATETPGDEELFAPGKLLRAKPVCPSGGVYTLGALGQKPSCSVAGHSLSAVAKWEEATAAINQRVCICNLREWSRAKEYWAVDNKKAPADVPTQAELVGPKQYLKEPPSCPEGGIYKLGKVGEEPSCSAPGHSLSAREKILDWPVEALPEAVQKIVLKAGANHQQACINNLRQMDGAKEQWALENKRTQFDTPTFNDLVGMDKYIRLKPVCPAGGIYFLNNMSTLPQCTIPGHKLP